MTIFTWRRVTRPETKKIVEMMQPGDYADYVDGDCADYVDSVAGVDGMVLMVLLVLMLVKMMKNEPIVVMVMVVGNYD